MLETIPMHLHSLAYIPRIMLKMIRNFFFIMERDRIPLTKWETINKPKDIGSCGLKTIRHFGKAWVAKILYMEVDIKRDTVEIGHY